MLVCVFTMAEHLLTLKEAMSLIFTSDFEVSEDSSITSDIEGIPGPSGLQNSKIISSPDEECAVPSQSTGPAKRKLKWNKKLKVKNINLTHQVLD